MAKTFRASPWWDPQNFADKRGALTVRGAIRSALRRHFETDGFTEVECGTLCVSPGNEAHLTAFATTVVGLDGGQRTLYLHTSPEFACKKLLAAGMEKIFDFARVFRNREGGSTHANEFTMLEWYRAHAPYATVMEDTLDLLRLAARVGERQSFAFRGMSCDVGGEAEYLSLSDAFARFAGIDLAATLTDDGVGLRNRLAVQAETIGISAAHDDTWSDIFSKVLVAKVEPELGRDRPVFLYRYPRCEAALARACPDDPRFAERFELYVCGVELANGFGELTDAHEQRQRFEAEMDEMERVYGERYPIDEDFLAALSIMPPSSGVAMGFDRLVMLAVGARTLADVMWTQIGPAAD